MCFDSVFILFLILQKNINHIYVKNLLFLVYFY